MRRHIENVLSFPGSRLIINSANLPADQQQIYETGLQVSSNKVGIL